MPACEVAERLGLTLNTLDARLSRARRQLRDILSGPLRDQAIAFGLALAPADEMGWRDSRLWCHYCGQARLQGILEDTPTGGRMVLRCPRCYQQASAIETHIESLAALQGLTSFRSAMKRLMRLNFIHVAPALVHAAPCMVCGTSLRARVVTGSEIAAINTVANQYPDRYYVISTCPTCGPCVNGAAVIAGRNAPDVVRFFFERQRFVVEPEEHTLYEGSPAIRFSLYDPSANDRIVYFADPHTLELRGVHRA
jgi:uncharacterized protein (UPF0212 family)